MNVVFFVTGLNSGGLENYLLRFLQSKSSCFNNIIVYCKGGKSGQLEQDFLKFKNVIILKRRIGYFSMIRYFSLLFLFKNSKTNVVCDFTGNFSGLILLFAKIVGIKKRVVFYRGSSDHFKKTILRTWYNNLLRYLTYKFATNVLFNSYAAIDFFFGKWPVDQRFHVIYNGFDVKKFDVGNSNLRRVFNLSDDNFIIGHTGRFNYAKNHKTILQVAEILIKRYPNIYFILCGNGVRNHLESQVIKMGIQENVKLFENRTDIPVFLNTMNAFFFPSVTEGQPNSLIEAMIMGLPFVASNIPSIKEIVEVNSLLFDPNDVNGFAKALEGFYLERKHRDHHLRHSTMLRFDGQIQYEEFYNKLK